MTTKVTFKGNPLTLVGETIREGHKAPDFVVLDQELKELRLQDLKGMIKVISVTPSLDTPVCDLQLRRFNEEAARLGADITVLNISMDLPFAISRFCTAAGIDKVKALSDHRDASFGHNYGLLIEELRLLTRAVVIIDKGDIVRYVEIVKEITNHPDYAKALEIVGTIKK